MSRSAKLLMLLSAGIIAAMLSGCADNRLDGGYTGDTRTMTRLTPSATPAPFVSRGADDNPAAYAYRGGRDPVTGKASLSY